MLKSGLWDHGQVPDFAELGTHKKIFMLSIIALKRVPIASGCPSKLKIEDVAKTPWWHQLNFNKKPIVVDKITLSITTIINVRILPKKMIFLKVLR